MNAPEFWIIAGPNGAGKTTCVQRAPISDMLPHVGFLNPDDLTLAKIRSYGYRGFADCPVDLQARLFIESANEVYSELERALDRDISVGVETVLSTKKYCSLVHAVVARLGFVGSIYIALSSPAIAEERVAHRVQRGGHGVPEGKIAQRWARSLDHLTWFAANVSRFWIYDNSDSNVTSPPVLLAHGAAGHVEHMSDPAFLEMKTALAPLPRKSTGAS